jgi:hypothetical protein
MKILPDTAILILMLLSSCHSDTPNSTGSLKPSHEIWTKLLNQHVDVEGNVNYQGFQKDSSTLNEYLDILVNNPPDKKDWPESAQLAYWINVYNAFTIKLIIDHYPVESIRDIGSKIQIPFINSPWDIKLIEIEGKKYDLNNVEHSILRKNFEEPRIHFAIVCASFSCPKLRREAYTAEKLEEQLQGQAADFINDAAKNSISKNKAEVSKIFSWFKGDFTRSGSLADFLNQYSKTKLDKDAKISYMNYDWSLNEVR